VDDILCFWLGTDMELEIFTSDLQKFDDNLSFTVERAEHLINFLNITISLKHDEIEDGLLTPHFSVYRKPEFTGVSIHNRSLHPSSHKFASITSAVNHMIRLPLSPDARKTINTIQQIAKVNGLQLDLQKFIKRKQLKEILSHSGSSPAFSNFASQHFCNITPSPPLSSESSESSRPLWVNLPYLGKPSEALARELKRYGYRHAFYPVTQVAGLSLLKDTIPKLEKSEIYELSCSCGYSYVGQSRRSFRIRLDEHRYDFNKLKKRASSSSPLSSIAVEAAHSSGKFSISSVARHCHETEHPFDAVKIQPLYYCQKGRKMDRLEEYFTIKSLNNNRTLNNLDAVFTNHFIRFTLNYAPHAPS